VKGNFVLLEVVFATVAKLIAFSVN